jgi:protein gp37
MGVPNYSNGFRVAIHENALEQPLVWKKPQMVFVNSMSDLFHSEVSDDFIFKIFRVMEQAHWHRFQILTKRPERLAELSTRLTWAPNIWVGVTVENERHTSRIESLRKCGAVIKFISFEPLLGQIDNLDLTGIDWAIVGGESGPGARPMDKAWVLRIQKTCQDQNTPFFFKQWGGVNKKKAGRELEGKTWNEMPALAFTPAF